MRAGREGITAADLYGIIYGNELPPLPSRKVLKAHAWQLRRLGFPIKGKSGGANEGAYDPRQRAVMRHVGSDVDALSATIGAAARLTVAESGTPRFARLPKDSLSQRNGSLPIAPNEAAGQRTPSVLASPRALCGERGGAP